MLVAQTEKAQYFPNSELCEDQGYDSRKPGHHPHEAIMKNMKGHQRVRTLSLCQPGVLVDGSLQGTWSPPGEGRPVGRASGKGKKEGARVSECVGVAAKDGKGSRTRRAWSVGPLQPCPTTPLLSTAHLGGSLFCLLGILERGDNSKLAVDGQL